MTSSSTVSYREGKSQHPSRFHWIQNPIVPESCCSIIGMSLCLVLITNRLFEEFLLLGSPVGMLMSANFAVTMLLLLSQTGCESPIASVLLRAGSPSSTFAVIVCCLAYLCMDPIVKTCYVLRSHHIRSGFTAEDLHTRLRQIRAAS